MQLNPPLLTFSALQTRPSTYSWPNGGRLAVYVAVNVEGFRFGSGLGACIAPAGPQPDVLNWSWREWGNRVGALRLLQLLDQLSLPVALLPNSCLLEHCPEVLEAFARHPPGCELVGHGRSNSERQSEWGEEEERRMVHEVRRAFQETTLGPMRGWLSPWIAESHVTSDILSENGFTYTLNWCHDDAVTRLATKNGGNFFSVPYPQDGLNDIPAIMGRLESPAQFADAIMDAFDENLKSSMSEGGPPRVMGIALHPYIIAQPHRLGHLRRALEHITRVAREQPEAVWLCTPGETCAHAATHL